MEGWDSHPWDQKRLQGIYLNPRVKELLNLGALDACFHRAQKVTTADLNSAIQGLVCDLSQNPKRKPWKHNRLPCLCSSTTLYSYEHDRAITTQELLRLLGWPVPMDLCRLANHELRVLFGESMCLQSHAVALWALFMATWQHLPDIFSST